MGKTNDVFIAVDFQSLKVKAHELFHQANHAVVGNDDQEKEALEIIKATKNGIAAIDEELPKLLPTDAVKRRNLERIKIYFQNAENAIAGVVKRYQDQKAQRLKDAKDLTDERSRNEAARKERAEMDERRRADRNKPAGTV